MKFSGDYKTKLKNYIEEHEARIKSLSQEKRMQFIEELTDEYVEQTGERPDDKALHKLTDLALNDDLTYSHADKMSIVEYPIMSEHQEGRRKEGRQRPRNSAGTTTKEVPLSHAQNVATDGRDHSLPIRSFTNPW